MKKECITGLQIREMELDNKGISMERHYMYVEAYAREFK